MKEEILKFIKENTMSTSDVADALGRKGHIEGIKAINKGAYAVGTAYYTYALHDSNWYTHRDFQKIPEGSIVFVDSIYTSDSLAIAGELMICYAQRKRGACGMVFNGSIRDVERLKYYNVWAKGRSPIVCHKSQSNKSTSGAINVHIEKLKKEFESSILVCDDTGIVRVPSEAMTDEFMRSLKEVRQRERLWKEELEKGKSTFDITCS